jgi:ABC-type transport system substrate-binding protein
LAFNYTGFIEEIVKGNALRNPAPLPNNIWGYPKDVAGYDFDLAKAKEYFQRAVAEGAPMRRLIELHVQQPLEPCTSAGQRLGQKRQALVHPVIDTAMVVGELLVAMREAVVGTRKR